MTIAITSSGIALDGPLVAGEKVAVTVSGLALAAEDKPTLALLARFPDALLASVELAEDAQTPGTWTGELDTATKQTALFFATARADERRDAALELVAGRVSLARLTVPMANSALCPKPDGSPFASPVYIPVPGPPGQGGDPYDQNPAMDGTAAPGVAEEYARGDHVHPSDTSRAADSDVLHKTGNETKTGKLTIKTTAVSLNGSSSAPFAEIGENGLHVAAAGTDSNPSAVLVGHDTITIRPNVNHQDSDNDKVYSFPATGGIFAVASQIPAAPVQSNWNESDSASLSYIQNKPTNVSAFNNDSGYLTATTARYAFNSVTPTTSRTTASVTLADRAINDFTVATGITSLTITPPAAVTGRARDFFCRVTLTDSSLPTVTLSGATIDIGASEVAGMTQGVNLLMFTEIASGHWLASRRSAS